MTPLSTNSSAPFSSYMSFTSITAASYLPMLLQSPLKLNRRAGISDECKNLQYLGKGQPEEKGQRPKDSSVHSNFYKSALLVKSIVY